MAGHYTYNPFGDEMTLSGLLYLQVSKNHFLKLAEGLIEMRKIAESYIGGHLREISASDLSIIRALEYDDNIVSLLFADIRRNARSYYEVWMLRHMMRVLLLIVVDYDIADYTLAIRHQLHN